MIEDVLEDEKWQSFLQSDIGDEEHSTILQTPIAIEEKINNDRVNVIRKTLTLLTGEKNTPESDASKKRRDPSGATPEGRDRLKVAHEAPLNERIKLLYTNTCSVRNKWVELLVAVDNEEAAIIALSETWLWEHDHVPNNILFQGQPHS